MKHPIVICLNNGLALLLLFIFRFHICMQRLNWMKSFSRRYIQCFVDALLLAIIFQANLHLIFGCIVSDGAQLIYLLSWPTNQLKSIYQKVSFFNSNRVTKNTSPRNVTQFTQMAIIFFDYISLPQCFKCPETNRQMLNEHNSFFFFIQILQ